MDNDNEMRRRKKDEHDGDLNTQREQTFSSVQTADGVSALQTETGL